MQAHHIKIAENQKSKSQKEPMEKEEKITNNLPKGTIEVRKQNTIHRKLQTKTKTKTQNTENKHVCLELYIQCSSWKEENDIFR